MTNRPTENDRERSKEFLLAEYRYLADSFWRNEEAGERRVSFFITLVTAVIAALVALATERGDALSDRQVSAITVAACAALLLVGWFIFRRLIHRNSVTDGYKASMDRVRTVFMEWDPAGLVDYEPFPERGGRPRTFGRGGLTDLVSVVNSVIFAAGAAALAIPSTPVAVIPVVGAAAFALALVLHQLANERIKRLGGLLPRRTPSEEVESTLIVASDAPVDVITQLSRRKEIAGYRLHEMKPETIRDVYFDTNDGRLSRKRIGLRARLVGSEWLITLKGPSSSRWCQERRLEIERSWSREGWDEIREELKRRGGAETKRCLFLPDPLETLTALGFEMVQDRTTERTLRNVMPRSGYGRRVGELALDEVVYHLDGQSVRHYEVEIEAKRGREGKEAVEAITSDLMDAYWPCLRPWQHGKLPTGKALAELLERRPARDLLGPNGAVKSAAYDEIAKAVNSVQSG